MQDFEERRGFLIVTEDDAPKVTIKPGMKFEVISLQVVDESLATPQKIAARLCGGGGTCMALVDIEPS